jgi:hypothetical protein
LSPWFWELIESLGGDEEVMRQQFNELTRQRLLAFRRQFDRARGYVKPTCRADFRVQRGKCSEDEGDDFAAWAVSRGRVFWLKVGGHPEAFEDKLDEFRQVEAAFVRPDYVVSSLFNERFGEEMVLVLYHPELVEKHRMPSSRQMGGAEPAAAPVCFALLRWRWVRLEHRSSWETLPAANDLQFSLRFLIGLTVIVALLLALGRIIQGLGQETHSILIVAFVFALVALLASLLVVWSCLGPGRVVVRGPAMLGGMMALGLVIPHYLGGPEWRFAIWPALLALIATFTGGSLVVVRSCGYRLVRQGVATVPPAECVVATEGRNSDA